MSKPRVVVTGLGTINPCGLDVDTTWDNLVHGRTGIGPITRFDPAQINVKIAAEVKDFDPANYMEGKEARRRDRFAQFAIAATAQALRQANLKIDESNADDIGVMIGTAVGGLQSWFDCVETYITQGPRRMNPFTMTMIIADSASAQVAIINGARGPNMAPVSACAAGADGIGLAYELLLRGDAKAMICGGSEATVTPLGINAFDRLGAMTRENDNPATACRPFSADRSGLVMGEGAAIFVIETLENALARGVEPLAELIGYGCTCDAFHISAPLEDGSGAVKAMRMALRHADLEPADIDTINAHATATELNDPTETLAIKTVLGEHAYKIPISGTKSMTGHMMGATGALEALMCVQAIRTGKVPPTINLRVPDPKCDLDYVPNVARDVPVRIAMTNAFGFGGHNSVLILQRYEEN
jgi:beta-ketoacyl-acyl-carrier-protein synthase II